MRAPSLWLRAAAAAAQGGSPGPGPWPPLFFANPIEGLQRYVKMPLVRCFVPDEADMRRAALFADRVAHLAAAVDADGCPPEDDRTGEVIFLGESNVGKSSLIKAMFRNAADVYVRTSRKPGHTRKLNFFQAGKNLRIVDVPGYGFRQPDHYVRSVEGYLKNRKSLRRTFLLTDGAAGMSNFDLVAVNMLEEFRVPYALVMTKIDKAASSDRLMNLLKVQELRDKMTSNYCYPQPFLVSSKTFEGMGYLQSFVVHVTTTS